MQQNRCKTLAMLVFLLVVLCGCAQTEHDAGAAETTVGVTEMMRETTAVETTEATTVTEETTVLTTEETTAATTAATAATTATVPAQIPDLTEPDPFVPNPAWLRSEGLIEPKVMMYHLVRDDVYGPYDGMFMPVYKMERHLQLINERGIEYLFADEYRFSDHNAVILTFDDGYDDNYTNLFPLLKKYNAKATIFLAVDLLNTEGYLTDAQVREMAQSGLVRFGSHTMSHTELQTIEDEQMLCYELEASRNRVQELTGQRDFSLAYPVGGYDANVLYTTGIYYFFAYTTNSPDVYASPSAVEISRFYIHRYITDEMFLSYLEYTFEN